MAVALVVGARWCRAAGVPLLCLLLSQAAVAEDRYGPIRPGESLWEIAGGLYSGAGLTREQVMLALLLDNPEAFSPSCNLNGVLRAGAMLGLPPVARVRETSPESAAAEVGRQLQEWRQHRRTGEPLNCSAVTAVRGPQSDEAIGVDRDEETARRESAVQSGSARPAGADDRVVNPGSAVSTADRSASVVPASPGAVACAAAPAKAEAEAERASSAGREAPTHECLPHAALHPSTLPMTSVAPESPVLASEPIADAAPPLLTEGPRAPAWAMIMLLLALVAIALVQWGRHWAARSARFSPSAAIQAAARLPRRAALLLSARPGDLFLLLLMSTLAGFFGALVTVVFREGIDALEWLVSAQEHGLVAAAESLAGWQRLILPALGGLVAGLILQQIGGLLRGRSTTDYMEAVSTGDGWISVRHSLVKAASSLVTVGSGGSIGREGAMVQLAAMVASAMGRISRFPRDRLRLLVAAGAAAGLAAAYNAPIAATLFVAEIVLGSIALQHIGPLIVAAVIANTTVHDVLGYAPVYDIPAFTLVSDWELALYLVLGVLAGHLGPVFLSLLERAHQFFGRLPLPLAGRMALGGLVVGAISVYEPQVWGNGYSVVNAVLHDPWAWQALLTVLVLKMIATAATHGSGAVGGAFTPTIFVGAMLGTLFGTVVNAVFPDGTALPNAYAVVGMGAMLAGTTHAPLMSILMVFELTLDYRIVLPLMLAVVTAHYVARTYTGVRPMYAESLLPREKPS